MNKKRLLIIASVTLNILLAGIVVGHMVRHFRGEDFEEIANTLPKDKQVLLRKTLGDIRSENRDAVRQLREEIVDILTAPDFDAQAYRQKTNELRQLKQQIYGRRSEAMQKLAAQLTQKERQALIKFLSLGHRKGHRRGRPGTGRK